MNADPELKELVDNCLSARRKSKEAARGSVGDYEAATVELLKAYNALFVYVAVLVYPMGINTFFENIRGSDER